MKKNTDKKRNKPRNMSSLLMAVYAAMARTSKESLMTKHVEKAEKFNKPCINCGKMHRHNNSFCSSTCHSTWNTANPNNDRLLFLNKQKRITRDKHGTTTE